MNKIEEIERILGNTWAIDKESIAEAAKQIADLYKAPEEVLLSGVDMANVLDKNGFDWGEGLELVEKADILMGGYYPCIAQAQLVKAKLFYDAEKENEIGKIRARIASGLNPPRNIQEEIDCPEIHIDYLEGILQGCERMLAHYLGGK